MGVKFKGKIMSNYSKEVEWQQGITTGIGFCVYSVSEYFHFLCHNGLVVSIRECKSNDLGSLPRSGKYDLLLNVWNSDSFVKEKQTHYFIFVVWSALVVGGCLMAVWGRKSYLGPAKIGLNLICCVYLVKFKDGGRRVICVLLRVNPRVRRVHLVSQFSWIAAWHVFSLST